MGFSEAIRTCFSKYVVISGRARRSEYWWWALFTLIASLVLGFIDGMLGLGGPEGGGILSGIFSLAVLLPSICVGGRRLHDTDRSAWWLLIGLIPLIGFIVLLVFFIQRGTEGPNRFGPDPLAGEA